MIQEVDYADLGMIRSSPAALYFPRHPGHPQQLHLELRVPDEGLTWADLETARRVRTVLDSGRMEINTAGRFTLSFDRALYQGEPIPPNFRVSYEENHQEELVGTVINLGPTTLAITNSEFAESPEESTESSLVLFSKQAPGTTVLIFENFDPNPDEANLGASNK